MSEKILQAYSLLRSGNPAEAKALLNGALVYELENQEILFTIACCNFWIDALERAKKAGLSEEKTVMLQHMILAHHYEPEFGSPVRPMFPEAELLHYLDMLDAKMFDFEAALESVDGGQFSERVRTLDNRMLYKPSFK